MPAEDLHPPVADTASLSFIETFMLRGGELIAGELHRERMLRTLREQGADTGSTFLQSLLSTYPWREVETYLTGQQILPAATYRLTLEYSLAGISAIRLVPYCKRTIRALRPILLPEGFEYSYKYADRSFFDRMKAPSPIPATPTFSSRPKQVTSPPLTRSSRVLSAKPCCEQGLSPKPTTLPSARSAPRRRPSSSSTRSFLSRKPSAFPPKPSKTDFLPTKILAPQHENSAVRRGKLYPMGRASERCAEGGKFSCA